MASPSHAAVSQGGGGAPAAAGDLGGDAPLVGNVGQEYVQSALSTSDPVTAIRDIQARGALADPRCRPLLGALDALGLSRAEAHRLVVQRAAEELLARVAALPPDRLLRLLEATFPFIGISDLRAVPLAVLDRLNPVPASFLKQLAVDRELFWELPAGVQRQAWQLDRGLLQAHALPLVAAYTYETATAMQALNMDETLPESGGAPAAGAAPARPATAPRLGGGSAGGPGAGAPRPPRPPLPHLARRNLRAGSAALRRLTAMVGRSEAVYRGVVDLCVARFRSGGGGACVGMQESALCALRSQLLMSLHDHGEAGICAGEGSFHKLAWTLDACLKDGRLDPRRLKELAAFFAPLDVAAPLAAARYQPAPAARAARAPRAARPAPERDNDAESAGAPGGASAAGAPQRELGDAGMALRDPAPFHLLLRQVVRRLEKCVEEAAVPRDDRELAFLTRLLALAVECRGLLRDRHFHFPQPHPEILDTLYPVVADFMLDASLQEGGEGGEDPDFDDSPAPPAPLVEVLARSELGRRVVQAYALARLAAGDLATGRRVLGVLAACLDRLHALAVPEFAPFAFTLARRMASLLAAGRARPAGALWAAAVDGLLVRLVDAESEVHEEVLRLLLAAAPALPPTRLAACLEATLAGSRRSRKAHKKRGAGEAAPPPGGGYASEGGWGGGYSTAGAGGGAAHAADGIRGTYQQFLHKQPALTRDVAPALHAYLDSAA